MTWCGSVGRRGGRFTTVPRLVGMAGVGVWVVARFDGDDVGADRANGQG